jgi:ABC-2 type transport system permease protein
MPLTHFLRVVRGVMLKSNGLPDVWPDIWPLLAFLLAVSSLAILRWRQTLD